MTDTPDSTPTPPVDTPAPEPANVTDTDSSIEVSPGGGVSFDQLEALESSGTADAATEVETTVRKEAAADIARESIEESGEVTEEAKVKMLKALAGDSEIEIPSNALFKKDDIEVSAEDLLSSYVGQKEIDRRFSEFDTEKTRLSNEKKKFESDVETIDKNFQKLAEMSKEGDHLGALNFLATMAGIDPIEYQKGFMQDAVTIADKFRSMSDEEQRAFWAEEKNKQLEKKVAERDKKEKLSAKKVEAENSVREVIARRGVSEQDFAQAYSELKKSGDIKKIAHLPADDIAERVCGYASTLRVSNTVVGAMNELGRMDLLEDKTLVDELFKIVDDKDSVEDVQDILREYLSDGEESEVEEAEEEKPKETSSKKVPTKKKKAGAKSERADSKAKKKDEPKEDDPEDVLGFDDIFETYGRGY